MRFLLAVLAVAMFAGVGFAEGAWPAWRGAAADGHTDQASLPLHWSETKNVVWKTPIHDFGHSTPVVWGDQIWLTTAKEDGTSLYVVAVDAGSGKIVHDVEVFQVTEPQHINPHNTYATPSPVVEEGRVYVHYGSLGTACLDTASGEVLWRRSDLNCEHMQGPASSPILFEDLLILHLEGTDKQFIVALNKATGESAWHYDRPEELYGNDDHSPVHKKSYQTPVIVEVDGTPQMVSNGALLVTGHNPRTGEEIWRVRYRNDSTISSIIHGNGLLFVNTGGPPGGSQLWGIRMGGTGDVTDSHVVWQMTENAPHQSSPVLVDDLLYMVSDRGLLTCMEATTGEQVWSERMRPHFGASLLAAPGRIYLSNTKGTTTVIAPGREYRELAENELDGELWASPAVTGNALVLRTKTHLYRIEAGE